MRVNSVAKAKVKTSCLSTRWIGLALFFVVLLVAGASLRHASAEADILMFSIGARAMALPSASVDEPRLVRINGLEVFFRSQVVEMSLGDVLCHYRQRCIDINEGATAASSLLAALSVKTVSRGDEGYVACIDLVAADLETLVTSAHRFAETWDLSDIGAPRYVYAKSSEARADHTLVLTAWADGSLNLKSLVANEEAEGRDLPGIPAPKGARRVLFVEERDGPSRVVVYSTSRSSPLELFRQYRRHFAAHGWKLIERHPAEIVQIKGTLLLAAESVPRTVMMLARAGENGATTLILLEAKTP
jgi:hypothetical protein